MYVKPYLYFDGRTEEALNFYRDAIGAQIDCLMKFSQNPSPETNPPGSADKVMHAAFRVGDTEIFASDGDCGNKAQFAGVSLCITVDDAAEVDEMYAALEQGGQVQMPVSETFFAHRFGMVLDKFGVSWMVIAPKEG